MIEIRNVVTKKEQKAFIHFPWKIYKGNPYWVPPIIMDFKKIFNQKKHPFFEYGTIEHFLAWKNGEVVGRISAITNGLHEEHQVKDEAFFGFFECIDDTAVSQALFDAATNYLASKGYKRILGPASPSINYDYGLLIDGFNYSPRILMTYNPPYYIRLIEDYGFHITKKLLAYKLDVAKAVNHEKLKRGVGIIKKRYNVRLRKLNLKNMKEEIKIIEHIYRRAWEKNWGDLPFTDRELLELAKNFKPIADPNIIQFAYIDDKPVAMIIALPDWYEVFKTMNGRLLPFNIRKLWTKRKSHQWARVLLLGTLPEYRGKGLDGLLCHAALTEALNRGITKGEGSWILEDNVMMNRAMKNFFGEVYKTYAIYAKEIKAV